VTGLEIVDAKFSRLIAAAQKRYYPAMNYWYPGTVLIQAAVQENKKVSTG
jgi:hypothetical protein